MQEQNGDKVVGRRRLLRRAGTVAAGVAGAGAVAGMAATPAQAAPGDAVVQGATNNAGTTTTNLTNSNDGGATLELRNTAQPMGFQAGPALRLVPSGEWLADGTPAGGISADQYGNLWVSAPAGNTTFSEFVHTQRTSNTIIPVTPTRVVDTRYAWGRQFITNPNGNIAANGQLIANRSVDIALDQFVYYGEAVFLNVTVTGSAANGFVQVWPAGISRPNTSNVNYVKGQDLSNFALTAIGDNSDSNEVISLFTTQNTHVIIDVVAFVIGFGQVLSPDAAGARVAGGSPAELQALTERRRARAQAAKAKRKQ
ncbi:hypothetical protein ACI2K4_16155 [Micromonospora sp. NPDC050397]|uniref:hypothetical protein n=1 Tax=Micromonospora sp. NPDC050397 TaxID=3364279 RepID=UPI00384C07F8